MSKKILLLGVLDSILADVAPANLVILLIGAGLLAVSAWGWAGRSRQARWWVGRPFGPQLALGVAPGLGLIVFGVGLLTIFGPELTLVVAPPVLLGVVLELAGMFSLIPRWWSPRWYRELPTGSRGYDTTGALAAAMVGFMGRPGVTSAGEAARRFGRDRPLGSWHSGWVYDADTDERVHGMSRTGTIEGRLTLYEKGIVFAATRAEDVLRGKSTVLAVPAGDITGVEVVPARAGADGRPRKGWLYRSWFPRLAIQTADDVHLFDVAWGRAGQVAERVAAIARLSR
jgi:hypothetical protein